MPGPGSVKDRADDVDEGQDSQVPWSTSNMPDLETQDLEDMYNAPSYGSPQELADPFSLPTATSSDLPDKHPDKGMMDGGEKPNGAIGLDKLNETENGITPGSGQKGAALAKEGDKGDALKYTGSGLGDGAAKGGPAGAAGKVVGAIRRNKGRSAGIGGAIATIVFVVFGYVGASFEIIHMRQELLDNSDVGQTTQNVLKKRRPGLLSKLITKNGGYASKKQLDLVKAQEKLANAGLKAEKDAAGAITSITKDGENIETLVARGGDDAVGVIEDINKVAPAADDLYKGPATRSLIKNRFRGLVSWLKGTKKAGDSATEAIADQMDEGGEAAEDALRREAAQSLDEVGKGISEEEAKAGTKVGDASGGIAEDAAGKATDAAVETAEKAADDIGGEITAAAARHGGDIPIGAVVDEIGPALAKEAPGLFGKLAVGAAKSISITEPARVGCTARGTINFLSSIRNVVVAGLVAEGFVRFLTAADEAKAGVIQSSGLNIFMIALHSNGGYAASGAFQSVTGNSRATPSEKERALYSAARAATGFLAVLAGIVNQVPGINNPTVCRFAHNGLVIVGSAAVGAVIGFFSDGATVAATSALSIGLTVVQIALETIGVPLFANYMRGQVSAAFRKNSSWGPGLAAGASSFQGSVGGGNALGLMSRSRLSQIESEKQIALQYQKSKESVFDRYFNLAKSDSLVSQLAFRAPKTPYELQNNMTNLTTAFSQGFASGGTNTIAAAFTGNASAAAATDAAIKECYKDPQLEEHDIAVDALCYPIIANLPDIDPDHAENVLLNLGEIDAEGTIVSQAYKDYLKNCYTGRPGLLYTETVDKDGKNNPEDNTCVDPGNTVAGDYPETERTYAVKPAKSIWDRFFGEKAYAQTPTTTSVMYGLNQIRQAHYADMLLMDGMAENLNDDFGDAPATTPGSSQSNANLFVIGDSLTVGMNSLPGANSLSSKLSAAGWSPTINAQGCRGVYQPSGPIIGNGSSCPKATIVDGLTVVNSTDTAVLTPLKAACTYVIALGTNGTETTVNEFKSRAGELITKLKSTTDCEAPAIYWVNVRLKTNTAKAADYNTAIAELAAETGIRILDWDAYVTTVNGDGSTANDVTWPPADSTHHDTNGYTQKIKFFLEGLGPAPVPSGGNSGGSIPSGGFAITPVDTSQMECPVGPNITNITPKVNPLGQAYVEGKQYNIHMCAVFGIPVNVIVAQRYNDMFTAFDAAGFSPRGTYVFRDMATQIAGYNGGAGAGTYARPGFSNHQYGTAADIACNNKDGSGRYTPTGRGRASFLAGVSAYPCLDWIHKNSARFQLLLQCDGLSNGKEIRANSGGCEWWHLSPTGG